MFTDLVNSTGVARSLDPEDWHDLLDAYQHKVAEIIGAHGGTISQFQGDGVVAYFGWPQGIDTASQDALAAGLAIVDAVEGLVDPATDPSLPRLSARVGIHTGVVVIAEARAGGVVRPSEIFGEVPNLAARLQTAASPGEVVVSDATAALVTGWFRLEPVGATELKGFSEPIDVFRVIESTGIRSRLDAHDLTKFVGRQSELDALGRMWQAVRDDGPRTVLVSGDPGMGKSRLVREFTAGLRPVPPVLVAACLARDSLSPLQPFGSLLGRVPTSASEAARWVTERIEERPAILVLEDAHWADPTTLEVIERLQRSSSPLLVLVTTRRLRDAVVPDHDYRVDLRRLDQEEVEAIVDSLSGNFPISLDRRDDLMSRAGGVPLFLEELMRAAHEDSHTPPARGRAVPATLADLINARLDRLGDTRMVAQQAAVVGAEFDRVTLTEVADLDEQEAVRHLSNLVGNGIIEPVAESDLYRFRHALLHESAYESLLKRDRRRIHDRVAEYLKADPDRSARSEILAVHLGQADRPGEAIEAWERASRRAGKLGQLVEAAGHLSEALAQLEALPEGDERDAIETRIRLRLGQYQGAVDQSAPSVGAHLRRGLELASRRRDPMTLIEGRLTLAAHYQAVADYAAVHRTLDLAEEVALAHGADWMLPMAGFMRGAVFVWQGNLEAGQASIMKAVTEVGATMDEPPSTIVSMPGFLVDVVVGGYTLYAFAESLSGRPDDAARFGQWASDLARQRGSVHAQCLSWSTQAIMYQLSGDVEQVRVFAEQAATLADDKTTAQMRSWADALLSWADGKVPDLPKIERTDQFMQPYLASLQAERMPVPTEAIDLLDRALAEARATAEQFAESTLLRLKAVRLREQGDRHAATAALKEAIEVAQAQGARLLERRASLLLAQP